MVNPLDATLEAMQNTQDAIDELKVRKNIISEKQTLQDYDRIIKHLDDSIDDMISVVVIFQKYEKALQMTLLSQSNHSFCICKKQSRLSVLQVSLAYSLDNRLV